MSGHVKHLLAGDEAGASVRDRFRELQRAWWSRNRILALVAMLIPLAIALIASVVWPSLRQLCAGLGIGIGATLYGSISELAVPERIERLRRGSEGEQATAKQLRHLSNPLWKVVHDRAGAYGNLDHIVVGPSGVYLLDTKQRAGVVSVLNGAMRVQAWEDPSDLTQNEKLAVSIKRTAAEVSEHIHQVTGRRQWVTPIVVLWAQFDQGLCEQNGVVWVRGERLRAWLQGQPAKLSEQRVEELGDALAALPKAVWRVSTRQETAPAVTG